MSIENKKKLRVLCLVLFILYSISIVYFLIFSDMFGRGHGYEEMRYNLTPFLENLVGNVLAFVPFGMLIRWVRGKKTGFFTATLAAFAFSLSIELVQLITKLGVFDVDDIIMNTFGGMLGYIIYYILARFDRKRRKKIEKQ